MASCPPTPLYTPSPKDSYFPRPSDASLDPSDAASVKPSKQPARIGHGTVCGDLHLLVPGGGVADLLHVSHPLALSDIEQIGSTQLWRLSELLHALVSRGLSQRPTAERDFVARYDSWKLVDMLLHQRFEGREPEPEGEAVFSSEGAGSVNKQAPRENAPSIVVDGPNGRAARILRSLSDAAMLQARKERHLQRLLTEQTLSENASSVHHDDSEADLEYEERLRQLSAEEDERLNKLIYDTYATNHYSPSSSHLNIPSHPKFQRSASARLSRHNLPSALQLHDGRRPSNRLSRTLSRNFSTDKYGRSRSFDLIRRDFGEKLLLKSGKAKPPPVPPKDPWLLVGLEKFDEQGRGAVELE